AVKQHPGRARSHLGAARAAVATGDRIAACASARRALEIWSRAEAGFRPATDARKVAREACEEFVASRGRAWGYGGALDRCLRPYLRIVGQLLARDRGLDHQAALRLREDGDRLGEVRRGSHARLERDRAGVGIQRVRARLDLGDLVGVIDHDQLAEGLTAGLR